MPCNGLVTSISLSGMPIGDSQRVPGSGRVFCRSPAPVLSTQPSWRPRTAIDTSMSCGTSPGILLTGCERSSAARVVHPRPSDERHSSANGYLRGPWDGMSMVAFRGSVYRARGPVAGHHIARDCIVCDVFSMRIAECQALTLVSHAIYTKVL